MSKEKTHKFQTWCKRCKFEGKAPDICIGCLVRTMGDLTVPEPPQFVPEVKE